MNDQAKPSEGTPQPAHKPVGAGVELRLDPAWPVEPGPRYRGLVWNHPSLKDGTLVTTSPIVEQRDGCVITRSGSVYRLGRTYASERHAAQVAGMKMEAAAQAAAPLQVIDLEADDNALLGTHSHESVDRNGLS